ncbi:MAG: indole-3-glycerol phosphate synthase TrpC [bacterium]
MILDRLAEAARRRTERQKKTISPEEMERKAFSMDPDTGFPFEKALAGPGMSFICECKKASPSKGIIAPDFPYLEIAREYEAAGAAAVSVLTEEDYFLGSLKYLEEIAGEVRIPVLRKDFTVDPYQIHEAKVSGAAAVLLICALLSRKELEEYLSLAHALGLSALVETHDREEADMAVQAGARIIGVNNRDLRTFAVDLETSLRLRDMIPRETLFVSESGIRSAADVGLLYRKGTDAVLIGETLMRSPDKKGMLEILRSGC